MNEERHCLIGMAWVMIFLCFHQLFTKTNYQPISKEVCDEN